MHYELRLKKPIMADINYNRKTFDFLIKILKNSEIKQINISSKKISELILKLDELTNSFDVAISIRYNDLLNDLSLIKNNELQKITLRIAFSNNDAPPSNLMVDKLKKKYISVLPWDSSQEENLITFCALTKEKTISFNFLLEHELSKEEYATEIKNLFNFLKKNKIKSCSDIPLLSLLDESLGGICPAGKLIIYIDKDLNVLPCRFSETIIGNLFEDTIEEVWNDKRLTKFAKIPEECEGCPIQNCQGGCRLNPNKKDKNCFLNDKSD